MKLQLNLIFDLTWIGLNEWVMTRAIIFLNVKSSDKKESPSNDIEFLKYQFFFFFKYVIIITDGKIFIWVLKFELGF